MSRWQQFWSIWSWFVVLGGFWIYRHKVWALELEDFFERTWAWSAGLIWCGLVMTVVIAGTRLL